MFFFPLDKKCLNPYVEMEKLTLELLRVFIRKIQIFEKTEK